MVEFAEVDGRWANAVDFSVLDWSELQAAVRAGAARVDLPYCECRGHLARSILQTQFFRHYNSDSDCVYATSSESAEHIFAKEEIAAGARVAGASATVEQSSARDAVARWRADVLVEFGTERFAFEVQVSAQPTDEYLRRHRRYTGDRVDAVWFVSGDPAGAQRLVRLAPAFQLQFGFNSATVTGLGELSQGEMELREFAGRWVCGWRPARPGFRRLSTRRSLSSWKRRWRIRGSRSGSMSGRWSGRTHARQRIWPRDPARTGAPTCSRGAKFLARGFAWNVGGLIRSRRDREVRASRGRKGGFASPLHRQYRGLSPATSGRELPARVSRSP